MTGETNGYKRVMVWIGLVLLGFLPGMFADRMLVERREANSEQRLAVIETRLAMKEQAQAEQLGRIEYRLKSIEAAHMELLVQFAELRAEIVKRK